MEKTLLSRVAGKLISAGLIILLSTASLPPIPARAASSTYYVNNTNSACKDTNSGTTVARPFCTIGKAASVAVAGDTVSVLGGAYAETVNPKNSGSSGLPVIYVAAPGVTVSGKAGNATTGGAFRLFNMSYIVIFGFTVSGTADYGIYVSTSHDIQVMFNHVSFSGSAANLRVGIYLTATTNSVVNGNTVDHNTLDGIRLNDGSNNNLVAQNTVFANSTGLAGARSASGISLLKNSNQNTLIRNLTYANEDSGINIYTGSSYNNIVNNVIYGNGNHGIADDGSPYNVFNGNTVQGNATSGINIEVGSVGTTLVNNISVDNGYRRLVGGGTFSTSNPGNLRVDDTSMAGTSLDYDLVYGSVPGAVLITWGLNEFPSLAAFQAYAGQEMHGLQSDPLFIAPAPIAERPPDPGPYGVAVNTGDYRLGSGSSAIDSANSDAPLEQAFDLLGLPRVDIASVPNTGTGIRLYDDRGAYEFILGTFLPLVFR